MTATPSDAHQHQAKIDTCLQEVDPGPLRDLLEQILTAMPLGWDATYGRRMGVLLTRPPEGGSGIIWSIRRPVGFARDLPPQVRALISLRYGATAQKIVRAVPGEGIRPDVRIQVEEWTSGGLWAGDLTKRKPRRGRPRK